VGDLAAVSAEAVGMSQKRLPFRRRQTSQSDQILRDRNKFERENIAAAEIIVRDPGKVGHCILALEWCALVLKPELEDDGEALRIIDETESGYSERIGSDIR
jgi:hypothetical protein